MEHLYYIPSGKIPVKGLIISLLSAVVLTLILSILYIALQWFIPFIYFNFFITLGLGIGVALSQHIALSTGKIRNIKYGYLLSILCGLLACYAQWALFISLLNEADGSLGGIWVRSSFNLNGFWMVFTHPQLLFQSLIPLNKAGTFMLKHNTVSGGLLWFIWAVEALIIIGLPILLSGVGKASMPFSELNNSWMEERELDGKLKPVVNKEELIAELGRGNFKILKDFLPAQNADDNYATVRIYESPNDPERYLTITNINHTINKKGESKKTEQTILEYFRITDPRF
ncbi:hypothetical protein [Pedobacter cryoconitis]|uniref:Uncharacterized protein n=1 Tax=Pedobacter cryoconitis TaxID=188932 RepID=A0A7X0IZY8_9SPHI|nr:hypothetical protein [Pedobacter cryoconitis]MBB6498550.1 hypothetical protein [Pedobacter cryoconitis]